MEAMLFFKESDDDLNSGILLYLKDGSSQTTGEYLRNKVTTSTLINGTNYHQRPLHDMIADGDSFRSPLLDDWQNITFAWVCIRTV